MTPWTWLVVLRPTLPSKNCLISISAEREREKNRILLPPNRALSIIVVRAYVKPIICSLIERAQKNKNDICYDECQWKWDKCALTHPCWMCVNREQRHGSQTETEESESERERERGSKSNRILYLWVFLILEFSEVHFCTIQNMDKSKLSDRNN